MSVGGVFTLITNEGQQDKLMLATEMLSRRIKDIAYERLCNLRAENPGVPVEELMKWKQSYMPTLVDIERTHVLFVNSAFKPFASIAREYSKTPCAQGVPKLGNSFSFIVPIIGNFVSDMAIHIKLVGLSAVNAADRVRYVDLLGHRLIKECKFKVQNATIDSYETINENVHLEYQVAVGKKPGYLRNIGQEQPIQGFLTADPTVDEVRQYVYFGNGAQTFKRSQPEIEMFIPVFFWFKDMQTSLPNFILPMQQTQIEVTLEQESLLVSYAAYGGDGSYTAPYISECNLYVDHIYLIEEIFKLFINKTGFQLIRVHRNLKRRINQESGSLLLHEIKWPIECLYIGFRPVANETNGQGWYKNMRLIPRTYKMPVVTGVATIQVNDATYYDEVPVVDSISLHAHDITIYPDISTQFYQDYIPYQFGQFLNTPAQKGWYYMNFNQTPGMYQPSGYINTSRARELYLQWEAAKDDNGEPLINAANPVDLLIAADCINFIVYAEGNTTLRFAT